jgi:N-acyl-D-aspartate/D-glutamate deacylase
VPERPRRGRAGFVLVSFLIGLQLLGSMGTVYPASRPVLAPIAESRPLPIPVPKPEPRPEPEPEQPPLFDTAILHGRVMDPETGYDQVAHIGIEGGKVKLITTRQIRGRQEIDARGRVVAPGFIDILSYAPNPYGIWYKIADGVTTNLGMHGLGVDAAEWFTYWEKVGSPAHFGGAFSYNFARSREAYGIYRPATPGQIERLTALAEKGLNDGWIGIDMSLEYMPGTSYAEVQAMAKLAARYGVPLFFHGRYSDMEPPGTNVDTLNEILQAAKETGAAVHVEHITSTGGTFSMERSLGLLQQARSEGVDITACAYPYNFWGTYLASARFDPGWQERFRISYGDLEIAGTGERLTAESFQRYRQQNKLAVAYAIPEGDVREALRSPFVMIGSDAILEPGNNNHPRSTGTFARVLGKYVREEQVLTLMEALAKMTILPAKRLEKQAPALRTKGRLQVGSDADITIFDPHTVADRSTVRDPDQYSAGMDWVLVEGTVVKDPSGLRRDVRPGRPIKSAFGAAD